MHDSQPEAEPELKGFPVTEAAAADQARARARSAGSDGMLFDVILSPAMLEQLVEGQKISEEALQEKLNDAVALYLFIREQSRNGAQLLLRQRGVRETLVEVNLVSRTFKKERAA